LEILENNCRDNQPNTFALCIHLFTGEHGEIWGGLEVGRGKSDVMQHKSDNIS